MTDNELKNQYDCLAHQIEREDGLINTRITWLLTFQGFLFAALAIVANNAGSKDVAIYWALKYTLPVIGISIGVLGILGVRAALIALSELKDIWDQAKFPNYPPPYGKPRLHAFGSFYSQGIPIILSIAWTVILLAFAINDLGKLACG
ncbi:hypothetical protein QZJ86_04265 [Methylomonas montana]|uniref:hypothetical protein n=1 Tax=Methylomonas montana TaxID=3058963 RepID=UPI002657BFBA|nr:hypothetical protein [Methylomonas montana]WKJ91350.1 hypothetical protein QZJ86_04265 [Methylomonas montana]